MYLLYLTAATSYGPALGNGQYESQQFCSDQSDANIRASSAFPQQTDSVWHGNGQNKPDNTKPAPRVAAYDKRVGGGGEGIGKNLGSGDSETE